MVAVLRKLLQRLEALGQAVEGRRRGRGRCRDEQQQAEHDKNENDELAHGTPPTQKQSAGPLGRVEPSPR